MSKRITLEMAQCRLATVRTKLNAGLGDGRGEDSRKMHARVDSANGQQRYLELTADNFQVDDGLLILDFSEKDAPEKADPISKRIIPELPGCDICDQDLELKVDPGHSDLVYVACVNSFPGPCPSVGPKRFSRDEAIDAWSEWISERSSVKGRKIATFSPLSSCDNRPVNWYYQLDNVEGSEAMTNSVTIFSEPNRVFDDSGAAPGKEFSTVTITRAELREMLECLDNDIELMRRDCPGDQFE